MMGGHHAISGTAGWMALAGGAAITASDLGMKSFGPIGDSITLGAGVLGDLSTPEVLAGAVVATGAALLPDIDHPSATIAQSGGGVTKKITKAVSSAAGHRGATHTPLLIVAFMVISSLAAAVDIRLSIPLIGDVQVGAALIVMAMTAFGVRAMKVVRGNAAPWAVGIAAALIVAVAAPDNAIWLPLAVGVGSLIHLIGDLLTTDGLPFPLWPLNLKPKKGMDSIFWHKNGNVALPILGNAGSKREWLLCALLTVYVVASIFVTLALEFV